MRMSFLKIGSAVVLAATAAVLAYPRAHVAANTAPAIEQDAQRPAMDGTMRLAQVGPVSTYLPAGSIRGVALFMSGDGGWNLGVVDMAKALTRQGIAVAGFSTPAFQKSLEGGADHCVNPNYALAALAQDFEHRIGLDRYIKPILVGYSSGATLAYGALAQAPAGAYRGAVSLGFGPDIGGKKPWCAAPGLSVSRITKPEAGWLFAPVPHLSAPWLVLQGLDDQVVAPAVTRSFTGRIPEAQLIELAKVGHGFSVQAHWMPQFTAAFAPMLESGDAAIGPAASVDDLPLNIVTDPTARRTNLMAVMYSGDGGWVGLDRAVATRLAASGVPVVGIDSLDYFWNAKSPQQAGSDLGRIVNHFSQQWQRPRLLLLGYSFGADDLPFIVDAMPQVLRPALARVSMLGLSGSADFQFHLASWLDVEGANALPTVPQIRRLKHVPFQCIRGTQESDSACPSLPAGVVQAVLPGGHHFGGNADLVAATVLRGIRA